LFPFGIIVEKRWIGAHVQTDHKMHFFINQTVQELLIGELTIKHNRARSDQLLDFLNGFEVLQVARTGLIFNRA